MKKSLVLLMVTVLIWGCNKQTDPKITCLVKGTVKPVLKDHLALMFNEFLDSAKIDQEGSFYIEVPAKEAGNGLLMYNNSMVEIYLESGKNLEVNIKSNSFPANIDFKGDLGPMNHYMQLARKLDQQTDIDNQILFSMEPGDFIGLTDSIRQVKSKLLEEYVHKYPEIDSSYAKKKEADILYKWASEQLLYPGYFVLTRNETPELPDNYHNSYLEKLELNNSDLLISQSYVSFLENYLDYREAVYLDKHPEVNETWFPGSVARFRVIHEEFTDEDIKNLLLFKAMSDHLDNFGTEHIDSFITNFRIACTNEEFKAEIEEKFNLSNKLARGQIAPDLEFLNPKGEKIKLSDLKGELLYINFWASWSDWSIQEFSHWEKLRKEYDGYDVKFVSVSMDFAKDKNMWKYIIEKQNLGGLQLLQDPESTLYRDNYLIKDLPRYLLIDHEGKIISAYAPRPSENMSRVLDNLLKQ